MSSVCWSARLTPPARACSAAASLSAGPGDGITRVDAPQCGLMPELPDLDILADAFHAALCGPGAAGHRPSPSRWWCAAPPESCAALTGHRLASLSGSGASSWSWTSPHGAHRHQPHAHRPARARGSRAASPSSSTAFVLRFGARDEHARPADTGAWTADAAWLPPDDAARRAALPRPHADGQGLRAARRASPRRRRLGASWGPTSMTPAWTWPTWRARIRRHTGSCRPCSRTRPSWRASATATPTRSCGPRDWPRSAIAPRSPPEESDRSVARQPARHRPGRSTSSRQRVPPRFEVEAARLPARPPQGWAGLSPLRHDDRGDLPGRLRHVLVPRLPGLRASPPPRSRREPARLGRPTAHRPSGYSST